MACKAKIRFCTFVIKYSPFSTTFQVHFVGSRDYGRIMTGESCTGESCFKKPGSTHCTEIGCNFGYRFHEIRVDGR